MISIITPWRNASELCPMYSKGVRGAEVIAIDNGSDPEHSTTIRAMVEDLGGIFIRNEDNKLFAATNNQGLARASGDIIVFMNNDVECRKGFLEQVEKDVENGALYGPSKLNKLGYDYLEGWCIAARHEVWDKLAGWDAEYFTGLYWEDNDLCFRAQQNGFLLIKKDWPVWHFNNYTTNKTPGAKDNSASNMQKLIGRIEDAQSTT